MHPHPALTDGAEGQLGLKRHPKLAHHEDIQRGRQRLGDLEGHRDPASRQAQHDNVLAAQRFQALGQLTPGIDTIVEQPHIAAQRSQPPGQWTPGIATFFELRHLPSVSRWVAAPKGRMATPVGTKAS